MTVYAMRDRNYLTRMLNVGPEKRSDAPVPRETGPTDPTYTADMDRMFRTLGGPLAQQDSTKLIISAAGSAFVFASSTASFYHGLKRNGSLGWGLWWGFMGAIFPGITPAYALYQGFGEKAL